MAEALIHAIRTGFFLWLIWHLIPFLATLTTDLLLWFKERRAAQEQISEEEISR